MSNNIRGNNKPTTVHGPHQTYNPTTDFLGRSLAVLAPIIFILLGLIGFCGYLD